MERELLTALMLAERLGRRPQAARCHLRLAWLYSGRGRPGRDQHLAAARSLLEQMGGHLKLDTTDRDTLSDHPRESAAN